MISYTQKDDSSHLDVFEKRLEQEKEVIFATSMSFVNCFGRTGLTDGVVEQSLTG